MGGNSKVYDVGVAIVVCIGVVYLATHWELVSNLGSWLGWLVDGETRIVPDSVPITNSIEPASTYGEFNGNTYLVEHPPITP